MPFGRSFKFLRRTCPRLVSTTCRRTKSCQRGMQVAAAATARRSRPEPTPSRPVLRTGESDAVHPYRTHAGGLHSQHSRPDPDKSQTRSMSCRVQLYCPMSNAMEGWTVVSRSMSRVHRSASNQLGVNWEPFAAISILFCGVRDAISTLRTRCP